MDNKSRSAYQTEYRKRKKTVQFNTSIPTEYNTKLNEYLISQGMSKTEWIVKMIKKTLDID